MHDQVTELAQRGKALLPEERSRLLDILLESLHEPVIAEVEAAWHLEIERHLADTMARKPTVLKPTKFSLGREALHGDQAAFSTSR